MYLKVEISDGKFCDGCMFNPYGTVECVYYGVLLAEESTPNGEFEINHRVKCADCICKVTES